MHLLLASFSTRLISVGFFYEPHIEYNCIRMETTYVLARGKPFQCCLTLRVYSQSNTTFL